MSESKNKTEIQEAVEDRSRITNRETSLRKERVPVHQQNTLTLLNLDPNFSYRWVNDMYGRVSKFLRAGWEIVEGDTQNTTSGKGRQSETQRSSQMWRTVNERNDAPCREGVLMRIPIDLFREDQAAKDSKIDADEKAMDPEGKIRLAQSLGSRGNIIKHKK